MRRLAVCLALLAAAAGCGGSSTPATTATTAATTTAATTTAPEYAYLKTIAVSASSVRFEFESPPREVRARYEPRSSLAECGSGLEIAVRGTAFVGVHFLPAASARIEGDQVIPTYTGPKRLRGPGPVLEVVKNCDFEADLGWVVGVARRLPLHVEQSGNAVTISFG